MRNTSDHRPNTEPLRRVHEPTITSRQASNVVLHAGEVIDPGPQWRHIGREARGQRDRPHPHAADLPTHALACRGGFPAVMHAGAGAAGAGVHEAMSAAGAVPMPRRCQRVVESVGAA